MTTRSSQDLTSIAIAYYSGYGHTRLLAQSVASGAEQITGVPATLVDVAAMSEDSWLSLDAADAIIFGSPTYIGGVAGPFKCFIDETSTRFKSRLWAGKVAGGFTISSSKSGDNFGTLQQLMTFALQQAMVWVGVGLLPGWDSVAAGSPENRNRLGSMSGSAAQAYVDLPAEEGVTQADRLTAEHLGQRVAVATERWRRGRIEETGALRAVLEVPGAPLLSTVPTGRVSSARILAQTGASDA